ncbi:A/G-specific adenine glycosylase [Marinospirillum sp.]|uniref:A/G-specific adenine glycosylase n=1 Tax=Marinospirillum sp. TaxID=2183934 RepID=UPI003A8999DD
MHADSFSSRLLRWYRQHGRHDLPWQQNPAPYRVWVSEIMLQQTQVVKVLDYYPRFMARFPTVADLAAASQDEVLQLWAGLGYYTRARNLHRCAQAVMELGGEFPVGSQSEMEALPGIGRSTAAAIRAFSTGQRATILDGNVKRVLTRYAGIEGWPGQKTIEAQLWQLAETLTPQQEVATYTQAIMDLGATLCKPRQPACSRCPHQQQCVAYATDQTARLPTPKPKKVRPQKERHFLLLEHQQQWLLERRPDQGIWGGLWSLPEFATQAGLQAWLAERALTGALEPQPQIEHAFTHYQLIMRPWRLQLSAQSASERPLATCSDAPAQIWYDPQRPAALGLPAPIEKLLQAQRTAQQGQLFLTRLSQ